MHALIFGHKFIHEMSLFGVNFNVIEVRIDRDVRCELRGGGELGVEAVAHEARYMACLCTGKGILLPHKCRS